METPKTPSAAVGHTDVTVEAANHEDTDTATSDVAQEPFQASGGSSFTVNNSRIYNSDHVSLIRRRAKWMPLKAGRLRNSLLSTMGLLELANAGDFAANVWNQIPVPIYAIVFMALGGTLALVISILALKDTLLSWDNVCYLRQERRVLKEEKSERIRRGQSVIFIDTLLDLNFRELGSEIMNRFGLDICSGFGAFLISIGTYMAIGGANHRIWFASNLLSGYIGNGPIALYGCVNVVWSTYVFLRAYEHRNLAVSHLRFQDGQAKNLVGRRTRNVHIYTVASGVSSLVGGAASMVTATRWQGYVALIPVILSSMFYNSWLRRTVSYDRPPVGEPSNLTEDTVIRELELSNVKSRLIKDQSLPLHKMVPEGTSLEAVLHFITVNDLLENLCVRLMQDGAISDVLADHEAKDITIEARYLLQLPKEFHAKIIEVMTETIRKDGPQHFEYRQRYLAEVLGSILHSSY
ncbi:uncharacterized protein CTRU02_204733 [Colletotrichum truncatum]|uniref:Integral membrane protein n=1 Tax=Colletotrichum truncatum TaxID=5467 RepID=A0ACC3ZD81_COLTU|nr:uncharacterized protein CTRU02_02968 [Colletotrichum truncatum]KAF6797926.1 integral membrane protein [Colletotrichum truncatum]